MLVLSSWVCTDSLHNTELHSEPHVAVEKKKKKALYISITDDKSTCYKQRGAMWAKTHTSWEQRNLLWGSHTNMRTSTCTVQKSNSSWKITQTSQISSKFDFCKFESRLAISRLHLVEKHLSSAAPLRLLTVHSSGCTGQPKEADWFYWVTLYECEAGWC